MLANTPGLRKYIDIADDPDSDQMVAQEVKSLLSPNRTENVSVFWKIILLLIWMSSIIIPGFLMVQLMIQMKLI